MRLSIGLVAIPLALAANQYVTGYDDLEGGVPNLLDGEGKALPSPYVELRYSSKWSVVNLDGELLEFIKPASSPNVIMTTEITKLGDVGGTISIRRKANFTLDQLSYACVTEILGLPAAVDCQIRLVGETPGGSLRTVTLDYKANGKMAEQRPAGLDGLKTLDVTLKTVNGGSTSDEIGPTRVLLDNLVYTADF